MTHLSPPAWYGPVAVRGLIAATIVVLAAACSGTPGGSPGAVTPTRSPSPTVGPAGATSTASTIDPSPTRSTPSAPPRTLLIDTDVAPDDLVALSFLLSAANVTVAGITVSGTGEAHCAGGVAVVLGLLERLGAPDILVACGRETPLAGNHAFPDAWRAGADQGSGLEITPTERVAAPGNAVDLIASLAAANDRLAILTLGPLTNLGEALEADPGLAGRLGPVFIMGGAVHVPGNILGPGAPTGNRVAEWNVFIDPHAAQVVVSSGLNPAFVSLDGTNQVPVSVDFARRARDMATTPAARVLAQLLDANPFMADGSYYLWDPLAAELAAGYPVGTFEDAAITIEEAEGAESGYTRPTSGASNIRYLSTVDPTAAEDTLLAILNLP